MSQSPYDEPSDEEGYPCVFCAGNGVGANCGEFAIYSKSNEDENDWEECEVVKRWQIEGEETKDDSEDRWSEEQNSNFLFRPKFRGKVLIFIRTFK